MPSPKVKVPLLILWRQPRGSKLVHAWFSVGGQVEANLCRAFQGKAPPLPGDLNAERCQECERRAYLFAVGLPHADRAAEKILVGAQRIARDYAVKFFRHTLSRL